MAKEIERKFLVREEILIPLLQDPSLQRKEIAQFYIVSSKEAAVRIRKTDGRDHAVLTVKSGGNGISSDEFEFDVALSEYAAKLEERVGHEIAKTRHLIEHNGRVWEVDVFHGALAGLIVAELECDDAAEVTDIPAWVGEEVTYDSRYKNAVLALRGKPEPAEMISTRDKALSDLAALDAPLLDLDIPNDQPPSAEFDLADALFSEYVQADGLTEGLMFAPGNAVFTPSHPSDASGVEAAETTPEEGVLLRAANKGHAVSTSPQASQIADAYAELPSEFLAQIIEVTENHRSIDQSKPVNLSVGHASEGGRDEVWRLTASEIFGTQQKAKD
ncbi:CYTH domain-containing protein [Agrobacterium rubi]|nr:CYTH domain-containing protein [Agrobacterium rubi]NTF23636.1 CYTH domain-containing protein [Agrobacterium rubi]